MGVDEGECVPILAYNNDRYVELFYAIPWAGGVVVPLNIRWAQAEFLPVLKQMKPRVIFLDDLFLGLVDVLKDADRLALGTSCRLASWKGPIQVLLTTKS